QPLGHSLAQGGHKSRLDAMVQEVVDLEDAIANHRGLGANPRDKRAERRRVGLGRLRHKFLRDGYVSALFYRRRASAAHPAYCLVPPDRRKGQAGYNASKTYISEGTDERE